MAKTIGKILWKSICYACNCIAFSASTLFVIGLVDIWNEKNKEEEAQK